jgi:hypothetical protein
MVSGRIVLVALAAMAACSDGSVLAREDEPVDESIGVALQALTSVPSGFSYYCSMTNGNAWGFVSGSGACESIISAWGWTANEIRRAGLYNTAGANTVTMRCTGYTGLWKGYGSEPLGWAFDAGAGHDACIFTVAPEDLPVFSAPFSLNPLPNGFNMKSAGMNFAATGFQDIVLNVNAYGQKNNSAHNPPNDCAFSGCSSHVNYRGQDRQSTTETRHWRGIDWGMSEGTSLLALASGTVVAVGTRFIDSAQGPNCDPQMKELWIKYEIGPSANSYYKEAFYVGYGHMASFAAGIQTGSAVSAGQVVGTVGWSGLCGGTAASHLHINVVRASNTARYYQKGIIFDTGSQANPTSSQPSCGWGTNADTFIDPYGWKATNGIDPGAYLFYDTTYTSCTPNGSYFEPLGMGAMSINLWEPGSAPPKTCDQNNTLWSLYGGGTSQNPYRTSVDGVSCSSPL